MKYYIEVQDTEHYLNPFEIASLYGVHSNKGQAHNRFVARLLTEYCKIMNIDTKIYYQTKQGMMRVYPASIYRPLMDKLLEDHPLNTEICMEFDNKNHYFILKKTIEQVEELRQLYTM